MSNSMDGRVSVDDDLLVQTMHVLGVSTRREAAEMALRLMLDRYQKGYERSYTDLEKFTEEES